MAKTNSKKTPVKKSLSPKVTPPDVSQGLKKNRFVRFLVIWLVAYMVLLSFFFKTVLSGFNYIEIFPHELILPAVMYAVTALIITVTIYWLPWLHSFVVKLVAALVLILLLVGYDSNLQAMATFIKAFFPGITENDSLAAVSVVYMLLLFVLANLIGVGYERLAKRFKHIKSHDVQLGIFVLVAFLFVVPAVSLAAKLPTIYRESTTQAPKLAAPVAEPSSENKPDIYYIVLDRYTNASVLQKQFSFDNTPFTDFLTNNGFHVNNAANSNYPYTTMSLASTLNGQYTNELVNPFKDKATQSRTLYHNLIQQSSMVKALQQAGYTYHSVGSSYGATYKAPLTAHDYMRKHHLLSIFGKNKSLRGIEAVEFMKSPYYRFAQIANVSWWPLKISDNNHVSDISDQLSTLDQLANQPPGGRFIFAHILVPHDPFYFNADGSLATNPGLDSIGKPVKQKYVGQVEFINTQIQELVTTIQQQTGGTAAILLNADEGPYPQFLNDTIKNRQLLNNLNADAVLKTTDMRDWPEDWLKMKFGILQAVHIPRATPEDLAELSSVNLLRIILNRYAGFTVDYLPSCQLGLTKGNQHEYNYVTITNRFTTEPNPYCQQLQSQPE